MRLLPKAGLAAVLLMLIVWLAGFYTFSPARTAADESPVPIEGKLVVSAFEATGAHAYYLQGDSGTRVDLPLAGFVRTDISPLGDKLAYDVAHNWPESWPPDYAEIWTADIDGSNKLNLTDLAGVRGLNCRPDWSPDGSQIAFMHCDFDPLSSDAPCDQGFAIWVVNADGTEAHRATPKGLRCEIDGWSPNGYRLLGNVIRASSSPTKYVFTVDSDGTDFKVLQNLLGAGISDWSPDGSMIASDRIDDGQLRGIDGFWRRLVVANADGTGTDRALYETFISHDDYRALLPSGGSLPWLGPTYPKWSPDGDRIAFLGTGLDTDPSLDQRQQVEVWIYDLKTEQARKITHDGISDHELSWKGENTFADDPEITVDNTTVTFSAVRKAGTTTIIRDDDPPPVPPDFEFAEEFYRISTTAEIDGPIHICMTYRDEDLPPGCSENDLCIFHYLDGADWEDVTVSRDPVNNVVCAESDSLSLFTLARPPMPTDAGATVPPSAAK